jgi:hypothetical protein
MKQLAFIPCWNRPHYLAGCLKRLAACTEQPEAWLFSVDRGEQSCIPVIQEFLAGRNGELILRKPHGFVGNTYNMLEGYADALRMAESYGCSHVNMVEDDIYVAPGYFAWHREIWMTAPKAFFASACLNQERPLGPVIDMPYAAYKDDRFQSLGVSFPLSSLREIIKHRKMLYYMYPTAYVAQQFPDSQAPPEQAEQAGLWKRIIEAHGAWGVYPFLPRAWHCGLEGKNQKSRLPLPPERLGAMTADEINDVAERPCFSDVVHDGPEQPISYLGTFLHGKTKRP